MPTATLPPMRPAGNGTLARNWFSQSYLNIDEGIAAADGATIVAASPISNNRNVRLVTSFLLEPTPSDFVSMTTVAFSVRWRADNNVGDDSCWLGIRIVTNNGIGQLAEWRYLGGNRNDLCPIVLTNTVTPNAAIGGNNIKTVWDECQMEVESFHQANMGANDNTFIVDAIEVVGTYESSGTPPPTFGIPARPAVARPFAPLLTL